MIGGYGRWGGRDVLVSVVEKGGRSVDEMVVIGGCLWDGWLKWRIVRTLGMRGIRIKLVHSYRRLLVAKEEGCAAIAEPKNGTVFKVAISEGKGIIA